MGGQVQHDRVQLHQGRDWRRPAATIGHREHGRRRPPYGTGRRGQADRLQARRRGRLLDRLQA
eukprot:8872802-Alexandrium_andersonii.AAC.1